MIVNIKEIKDIIPSNTLVLELLLDWSGWSRGVVSEERELEIGTVKKKKIIKEFKEDSMNV